MPDVDNGHSPGLGELSRQVRDVLVRFEKLATQLESLFVRRDIYDWQRTQLESSLKTLDVEVKDLERVTDSSFRELKARIETERVSKESHATLEGRVKGLEDNLRWIVRAVLMFVIVGILASAIVFNRPGGP